MVMWLYCIFSEVLDTVMFLNAMTIINMSLLCKSVLALQE